MSQQLEIIIRQREIANRDAENRKLALFRNVELLASGLGEDGSGNSIAVVVDMLEGQLLRLVRECAEVKEAAREARTLTEVVNFLYENQQ